ncbi:MAG: AAA family ATPase [Thermodesulfobacteriota bacterium]
MTEASHFTSLRFHHYKAFREYSLSLQRFNVLVGPNNSGKSTVLGAFRILAEGIRKANARNPLFVPGPHGQTRGYPVDLTDIPVATENVFYDYDDSEPATITFRLSNGNELLLFFPEPRACFLICQPKGRSILTTTAFRSQYNASIGFVPILGPVEHDEQLYQKEAARLALLTYRAARNFRNIWYHYPDDFDEFRSLIQSTWPGMDIGRPEIDRTHEKPLLHMFCPEERIPREIFWSGFGFQVWCQMLTYIVRGRTASLFMIDEPDIYLHADLQRQLVGILKTLGPDILLATHSTEIISEADPDDLVVINKRFRSGKRIRDPAELQHVFDILGSDLNPILTQLAKTRRAIFVEGKDFQVFSRFARKLGLDGVANRADFAVIPVQGFNPGKVRDFTHGIETTLGAKVITSAVFDRDYRSASECGIETGMLRKVCRFAHIHSRKELENFLLFPQPLRRAVDRRITERNYRAGTSNSFGEDMGELLSALTESMRHRVEARYLARRRQFERSCRNGRDDSTIDEQLLLEFDATWNDAEKRLLIVPGKETLSALNAYLQEKYGVTVSISLIVDSFKKDEVPVEMRSLLQSFDKFRQLTADEGVQQG